jgi:hypothetical protein
MKDIFFIPTKSENEMMIDYFYDLKQETKQKNLLKKQVLSK